MMLKNIDTKILSALPVDFLMELSQDDLLKFSKTIESDKNIDLVRDLSLIGNKKFPDVPAFYYKLAETYMQEKSWLMALSYWQAADLKFLKKPPGFYIQYAKCALELKLYHQARDIIATGIDAFNSNSRLLTLMHTIDSCMATQYILNFEKTGDGLNVIPNKRKFSFKDPGVKVSYEITSKNYSGVCFYINGIITYVRSDTEISSALEHDHKYPEVGYIDMHNKISHISRIGAFDSDGVIDWIYHVSITKIDQVLVGSDDWLFLRNDSNDSVSLATGKKSIGKSNELEWKSFFSDFKKLKYKNTVFAAACSKESVLSDFYPYKTVDKSLIDTVEEISKRYSVNFINPKLILKKNEHSFFKTDTHWSDLGAMLTLNKIFDKLEVPNRLDSTPTFNYVLTSGDLGSKLQPEQLSYRATLNVDNKDSSKISCVFNNQVAGSGNITIIENSSIAADGTVVIFGGSSSNMFREILKYHYARVVYINFPGSIVKSIVSYEHPEVIICQTNERYMMNPGKIVSCINDMPIKKGYASMAKDKLGPLKKYLKNSHEHFYAYKTNEILEQVL